jgi:GNAT superfamily N-acetyltransferase
MLAIRHAGPDDAELIHRFIVALAEYEREPAAVEVTPPVLRAQLAERPAPFECLIAELDGEPAGFALFFHNYSTWRGKRGIYLEDLFVDPARRGHGVGKALLAHIAAIARERDCTRLEWAVLGWNAPAIGFYERLGAKPLDEWTTFRLTGDALAALATVGRE